MMLKKERSKISLEKFENFLFDMIKNIIIIKKGFTSSTGCNLGKKIKSNHLVDPFISIPMKGTKNSIIKDNKKI